MTKIKLCGLCREQDVLWANQVRPNYAGFVLAPQSRRFVPPDKLSGLKKLLDPGISAVGVFVDEAPESVALLLNRGDLDLAQLHGHEDDDYIRKLRSLTDKPLIQAFKIRTKEEASGAESSPADYILFDSGAGTGKVFDWNLLADVRRPYFLAGGLSAENAAEAIRVLHPFAVDVSSGIETDGAKDKDKMAAFAAAVRKEDGL